MYSFIAQITAASLLQLTDACTKRSGAKCQNPLIIHSTCFIQQVNDLFLATGLALPGCKADIQPMAI